MSQLKIGAYYYPGWHPCKIRDASFPRGWSEWDLLKLCQPRFEGHEQPKIPLWGYENEADPEVFDKKLQAAHAYGVDFFVFASYWSRGKRLLEGALNQGFMQARSRGKTEFALMWANRMPRKVMPVKDAAARLIDPSRLVYTDPDDFIAYISHVADNYFTQPDYYRINDACYLSIFDTAFFIRQLGNDAAEAAVKQARELLSRRSLKLHLAAIDPIPEHQPLLRQIGFDSVTHYVFLPDWTGPFHQDFSACAREKAARWQDYQPATGLPYIPSVTPGWDASPRAVDYGNEKPGKYPWSPVLTGSSPQKFAELLNEARNFAFNHSTFTEPTIMISSWNEWTEGHYLEPDNRHGFAWLEAVKSVCRNG
ncbi:MAG: glycoside hydrolase family 99-like domain-containing protein [Candidatus Riflebacteria bacterium]|nr:glycoside hydrolase family 99-like domain-containing protein [Candidatus Riflebacteria bacterium]